MTKLNNTKFDKIRNSNFDETQKIKLWKKIKGSNCETTQTPQLGEEKKVFWEEHFDTSTTW